MRICAGMLWVTLVSFRHVTLRALTIYVQAKRDLICFIDYFCIRQGVPGDFDPQKVKHVIKKIGRTKRSEAEKLTERKTFSKKTPGSESTKTPNANTPLYVNIHT